MTTTAIQPEIEEKILRAILTEAPKPTERQLAKRFGVSVSSIHRLLARHKSTLMHALAQTNQPNQNEVTAALVVAAIPEATERIMAMTKDLTVSKMQQVLEQCESQYNQLKDASPQLAGAYLKEMRQTLESLGRWLNIENLNIDVQVDRARDERCQHCPYDEGKTIMDQIKEAEAYFQRIEDARVCPHCGKADKEPPISR